MRNLRSLLTLLSINNSHVVFSKSLFVVLSLERAGCIVVYTVYLFIYFEKRIYLEKLRGGLLLGLSLHVSILPLNFVMCTCLGICFPKKKKRENKRKGRGRWGEVLHLCRKSVPSASHSLFELLFVHGNISRSSISS